MASIAGAVTALTTRCFGGFVNRYTAQPGPRMRQVDPTTGHVSSKRRCYSLDDEPARWIDEEDRANILHQRLSFVAALKRTVQGIDDAMVIDSHYEPTHPTSNAVATDPFQHLAHDPFKGPQLSRFADTKPTLTDAVDVLGGIYSADFLTTLKNMTEKPRFFIEYPTTQEDIRKIKSTLHFLEDFPRDLYFTLRSARISRRTLGDICLDLMALLEKQPIPVLFKGSIPPTHLEQDEPGTGTPRNAQSEPDDAAMPGSFPGDSSSQVARLPDKVVNGPSPAPQSHNSSPEKGLSPKHRTIPMEMILHHIIPEANVATYGKYTPDASRRKKPTPRSILRTRLKSLSPANSKRLQNATKMKSVQFASPLHMPSPEPSSRFITPTKKKLTGISDPFYWRFRTPHSPQGESPHLPDSPLITRRRMVQTASPAQVDGSADPGDPADALNDTANDTVNDTVNNTVIDDTAKDGAPESTVAKESPEDDPANHAGANQDAQQETQPTTENTNNEPPSQDAQGAEQEAQTTNDTVEEKEEESNEGADEEDDVIRRREPSIMKTMIDSVNTRFPKKPARPFEDDDSPPLLGLQRLRISVGKKDDIDEISIQKQLEQEAEEARARAEAEAREAEKKRREEEEKLRRTGGLRSPHKPLIVPLSEEWTRRAKGTLHSTGGGVVPTPEGTQLRQHDFATVVPATEWLNDEIVNGSLQWLDRYINARAGVTDVRSHDRKFLACSTFMWERINQAGPGSTERALRRVGVSKNNFLNLDAVLLPLCERNHWTLIVIRPKLRTIAHMNSMSRTGSPRHIQKAREWVEATLKEKYKADEWTVANHEAPLQTNGHDCGVHTITNGICIALGLNPIDSYAAHEMPLQRLRIAAMLLNGGFAGDFDLADI
ncbi:hypothetical protein ACRALDRAFT_1093974 [Sodiomyces alcalophilus JCM 7366]|uniref:uncharacterized protein n=1 Tax=Sodiomyces alcalophilus JCM 7366 TaxID=591952 RepID=UPI0039B64698